MVKQYFPLGKEERIQERVMISLLAVFFLTMLTGLYTQSHNIDFDGILVPLLMFSIGLFYLLNGLNAFGKGNLVLKYVPMGLPQILQYILLRWASFSAEKAQRVTMISFAILSLVFAVILLSLGAVAIVRGV